MDCELKFDNIFSLSSGTPMDILSVVTVGLREVKKIGTPPPRITCLWDSEATNSMIKNKYIGRYESIMCYKSFDHSTVSGPYCTTHYVKVLFCMPKFS